MAYESSEVLDFAVRSKFLGSALAELQGSPKSSDRLRHRKTSCSTILPLEFQSIAGRDPNIAITTTLQGAIKASMAQKQQLDVQLPPFAPFPPANFRKELIPEEWEACLDAWILLAEAHLRLSDQSFIRRAESDQYGLVKFLTSYVDESAKSPSDSRLSDGSKSVSLSRGVFLLLHRLLSSDAIPSALLQWTFLAGYATVYPRSATLQDLLSSLWKRRGREIEESLNSVKRKAIKALESGNGGQIAPSLRQLLPLLHASSDVGAYFMIGSDFLDSIGMAYTSSTEAAQKTLTGFAYLSLSALCNAAKPNFSLLSDHVYSLKANAEKLSPSKSLLADIVTNTALLQVIRDKMTAADPGRARTLEAALRPFNDPAIARSKRASTRQIDKGKGKAVDSYGHGMESEIHVHRMSLITQIQDLFPDLGSAFIIKLLDEYNNNVETVTAHLLDNSLPPYLQALDHSEQLPTLKTKAPDLVPELVPRSTPSPPPSRERKNIFDNDELSNLTTDALSRLHIGRRNPDQDADTVLRDRSSAPNKAAILSALASFDSDDDERDDTYDVEDVGGTVDTTAAANGDEAGEDRNEEALYQAWKANASALGRDANTRRSKGRKALKDETGLTDEAIEGWGVMLARDPRRVRRLEARYGTWTGQQTQLERTAWTADDEDESERAESSARGGRGRGRGRGRGGFGGRGRGNVTGPVSDEGTQRARHRKEANKGSRANHNRREQRARKMARGGLPG